MGTRLFFVLAMVWSSVGLWPSAALAQDRDPVIYVFWAESCPHSQRAIKFIGGVRQSHPTWKIRDFEVERHPENAAAHARVLARIGFGGINVVPLIVVGEYAHIGFEAEETSGQSILAAIERCRTDGCPDRIGDLIADPAQQWTAATALAPQPAMPIAKPVCSGRSEERTISLKAP